MSGYLLSLVQRARGEGPALQPRARGRFEPAGIMEAASGAENSAAVVPRAAEAPLLRQEPHASAMPPVAELTPERPAVAPGPPHLTESTSFERTFEEVAASAAREPIAQEASPPSIAPGLDLPSPAVGREVRVPLPVHTRRIVERQEVETSAQGDMSAHTSTSVRGNTSVHGSTSTSANTSSTARSMPVRTPPALGTERENGEEEPAIRITIGRVDVRAVAPPAPARPATPSPRRERPLTLEDYLHRRDGGKR